MGIKKSGKANCRFENLSQLPIVHCTSDSSTIRSTLKFLINIHETKKSDFHNYLTFTIDYYF